MKSKNHFTIDYVFNVDVIATRKYEEFINLPVVFNDKAIGVITDTKSDGESLSLRCIIWKRFQNEVLDVKSQSIEWRIESGGYKPNAILLYDNKSIKPYSEENYQEAKLLGLDLDNWNDYEEFLNWERRQLIGIKLGFY